MTGVDVPSVPELKIFDRRPVGGDGLDQMANVVTQVDAVEDAPHEPRVDAVEDRHAVRAVVPLAPHELVGGVPCLAAEKLGEVLLVAVEHVYGEMGCVGRRREGVVFDGKPDQESGGLDAALGGEADETARSFAVLTDGRHDEQRVVKRRHESFELIFDTHAAVVPAS